MRSHPPTQLPLDGPPKVAIRWRRHPAVEVVRAVDGTGRIVLGDSVDPRARDAARAVADWLVDALAHDVRFETGATGAFEVEPADDAHGLLRATELVVAWLDDATDDPWAALGRRASAGTSYLSPRGDADRAVLPELRPALLTAGDGPAWWMRSIVDGARTRWLAIRHDHPIAPAAWKSRLGVPLVIPPPDVAAAVARAIDDAGRVTVFAWADDEPLDDDLAARIAARAAAHAANADLLERLNTLVRRPSAPTPRRGRDVLERIGPGPGGDAENRGEAPAVASSPTEPRPTAPRPTEPTAPDRPPADVQPPSRRAALESIGAGRPAPAPSPPELPSASASGAFDVIMTSPGPDRGRTARVVAAACGVSQDQAAAWCDGDDVVIAHAVSAAEARRIDSMVRPASSATLRVEPVSRP